MSRNSKRMDMECIHCNGRMKHATARFSLDRNGYHVSWDAVPAWVCTQCGEPFFEAREVNLIQNGLRELDREAQRLARRVLHRSPKPISLQTNMIKELDLVALLFPNRG